jgi:hypothetical protein
MSKRRGKQRPAEGPRVVAPVVQQVYGGGPLTTEQKLESTAVLGLGLVFALILVEGIFLGGSVRELMSLNVC